MFWHFYIGFIKCAPTLPFLVGAYRHIFVNKNFSIVDLIAEISQTEISEREEITIRFFSLIKEYVLVMSGALGYSSVGPLPLLNDRFVGYAGSARHLPSDYDEFLSFFIANNEKVNRCDASLAILKHLCPRQRQYQYFYSKKCTA
jgi:hypothetical protein